MRMLLRNVIFLLSLSMYEADKSFCFFFLFSFLSHIFSTYKIINFQSYWAAELPTYLTQFTY